MPRSTLQERGGPRNLSAYYACDTCGWRPPGAYQDNKAVLLMDCQRNNPDAYCHGQIKERWEEAVPLKGTAGLRLSAWTKKVADSIFAIGSLVLTLVLLPTVFGDNKPEVWTAVPTAIVLTVFAYTYASLTLWRAACTTLLGALLWYVIAVQGGF